jgi:hypothetical protein
MSDVVLEPQLNEPKHRPQSSNRNINQCYYRKAEWEADPGWLIVGPGPETVQSRGWRDKGRKMLEELSLTDRVSPKTGKRERIDEHTDNLGRNRYYWLLKNGGAKEFPISQLVAYKWHIKPPYGMSKEAFPQFKEYELPEPFWCAICPPQTMPKNSVQQLLQHLMVGHGLPLQEAKPLLADAGHPPLSSGDGLVIRKKVPKAQKAAEDKERKVFAAKVEAEVKDMPDPTKGKLTVCNSCGEQITGKLADHNCT